ncbi:MAG TPA: radical SAM protein [Spirochaetota bacterium]|nr:radical SAM protein [Spirochaetota bacterium]HPC43277.1 radical SAM protein [Spirochaetota bacterium]HQF06697.1 radical SAM protein [Spirochaetota bacterium]HQH95900.1 radical SAM protein [Spirochaetota bacterium]HQJ72522.1 radical SAM protein [Spirochaetota bacterium]
MLNCCILDCYVDEPACFGVPPFVSPYPRYIFGALADAGADGARIDYLTIDSLRAGGYRLEGAYDMVFLIGGAVVPGRYLGSKIGTAAEIRRIAENNRNQRFAVGGLISHVLPGGDNVILVHNDIEKFAFAFARGGGADERRSAGEIARWAVKGAGVVRHHPRFPDIICEVETSRGCPRESHCSFCSEGLYGPVEFREGGDIIAEVDALIAAGVSRFRLGRQADILQYRSDCSSFIRGFPRPEVSPLRELLAELRTRKDRGLISVLNIDNANPGTIAVFPEESSVILEDLAATVTPGDTMALGVESFDEEVVRRNNLKVSPSDAVRAIEIINEIGGKRIGSVPVLLPGVNLLHGLDGETMGTFETNFRYLSDIMERGLLVKRINIRQILTFPGTPAHMKKFVPGKSVENRFVYYRDRIRSEIEHAMLERIYPPGTIIRQCQVLETQAGYSYGKQIASYAITLKFPMELPLNSFCDAVIISHRERSLLALPCPININTLSQKSLELIPGISRKIASDIILARPFVAMDDAKKFLQNVSQEIIDSCFI